MPRSVSLLLETNARPMMPWDGALVKYGPAPREASNKMTTLTDMMRRAREDDPDAMRELVRELTRRGHIDVDAVVTGALEGARELFASMAEKHGATTTGVSMMPDDFDDDDEDRLEDLIGDQVLVRVYVRTVIGESWHNEGHVHTLGEIIDPERAEAIVVSAVAESRRVHAEDERRRREMEERRRQHEERERQRVASMTDEQRQQRDLMARIRRANAHHLGQLESQLWQNMHGTGLATASGEALDRIADVVCLTRGEGETDEALRARCRWMPTRFDGAMSAGWMEAPIEDGTIQHTSVGAVSLADGLDWLSHIDIAPPADITPPTHPSFPCILITEEDPDDT